MSEQKMENLSSQPEAKSAPTLPPTSPGDFLMGRGWTPVGCNQAGVEMWEPPNESWSHIDKEVLIPNLPKNKDKPQQKFTRRVIKGPATMPCTTMQALHAEKQKDA